MSASRLLARLVFVLGATPAAVSCGESSNTPTPKQASPDGCRWTLPENKEGTEYCHTVDDCSNKGSTICTASQASPSCGPSGPPGSGIHECSRDSDCALAAGGTGGEAGAGGDAGAGGMTAVPDRICVTTGGSTLCQDACKADASCGPLQACRLETGLCVAKPCDEATPCPESGYCGSDKTCTPKQCGPGSGKSCENNQECSTTNFSCAPKHCSTSEECSEGFECRGGECLPQTCQCDTTCGAGRFCILGVCKSYAGTCRQEIVCGRPLVVNGDALHAPLRAATAWV